MNTAFTVQARLSAETAIASGDQYRINVVIRDHPWSHATWMGDLASVIGTRALNQVALPGTHDSGTYDITAFSTIAPAQDLPQWVNALYALGLAGDLVLDYIARWSKTQPIDIAQQLQSGIRYFDLRVVLSDGAYYMCHGMYSANVDHLVSAVSSFIRQNPKEIVILDFNHLYQMSDLDANRRLVQRLIDAFGRKMAPRTVGPTTSLNNLWADGYQVIVLYAHGPTVSQHSELWPQSAISSPWPNTSDLSTLQAKLNTALSGRTANQLFVLQGILTPDGAMIGKGLLPGYPSSIQALAGEVTPVVLQWVQGWVARPINIVIVDWFTVIPNYVHAVVSINLKR